MRYTIEGGSLPVLLINLDPGEKLVSESGGRAWSRGEVDAQASTGGGIGKILGRLATGESAAVSVYTANSPAEIAFTSSFPGSIIAKELGPGESVVAQKSAYLCMTEGVEMALHTAKKISTGLFGGEGFLMQKFTGPGTVFFEIDGYCKEYDLQPGERMVCDTGVTAIMDESVTMETQMVKGLKNMAFGGEGLFDTVLTGPGKVWLQSITIPKVAQLILPFVQKK